MVEVKIGLEIHQQLDTSKLFCDCPSTLVDRPDSTFERFLRVTESEVGEIDRAALYEYEKRRSYVYQCPQECSCLVEMDEEPPHEVNGEALDIALTVSKLLKAKAVDVICFMRKIVIDGSNTTGFQRTALISLDGEVDGVGIATICLEEDSARKVKENEKKAYYNIDRLGIPLIEVATKPEIKSPDMARDVALKIGMLLKRTKVKKGLGTIRQDLNISISGMPKVEIKGVQSLTQIPRVLQNEIVRQENLAEIKEELRNRIESKKDFEFKVFDLTDALSHSKSRIVADGLEEGKKCLAIKLRGFKGLLSKSGELRLAKELMSYARIKGMFHGDELPGHGITESEVDEVTKTLNLGEDDSYVILVDEENRAKTSLEKIFQRAILCFDGVVPEVRKALENCYTEYMRPMPGSARMYPETDIPFTYVDEERLSELEVPETIEGRISKLRALGANEQQSMQLLNTGYDVIFEELVGGFGEARIVLRMLNNTIPELEDKGLDTSNIDLKILGGILAEYKKGRFGKEAIPDILGEICRERKEVREVVKALGLKEVELREVELFIKRLIEESEEMIKEEGRRAFRPLMGRVMEEYRGKIDGKVLSEMLKERLEEVTDEVED